MENYALEYLNERIKEIEDLLNGLDENRFVGTPERLSQLTAKYNQNHIDLTFAVEILNSNSETDKSKRNLHADNITICPNCKESNIAFKTISTGAYYKEYKECQECLMIFGKIKVLK